MVQTKWAPVGHYSI